MLEKLKNAFLKSNRWKHFIFAIPIGLVFSILCVLGIASGMEYKDYTYGNKWDWIDWIYTILGGLIGQLLQFLIIMLWLNTF